MLYTGMGCHVIPGTGDEEIEMKMEEKKMKNEKMEMEKEAGF